MKEFWTAERTIYPSIFRVLIGLLLLMDLIFTYPSFSLLFNSDINAFLSDQPILRFIADQYHLFIGVYAVFLLLFIVGIGRNLTSLLVGIAYFIMFLLSYQLVTWGDIILKFTLIFFVFVDSYKYLSKNRNKPIFGYISTLAIASIILHVFLIYLNNAYFKAVDKSWQDGVAVFYSFAQYPNFKESLMYPIISNGILSQTINYFIILLQLLFTPFVIWKKTRLFIIVLSAIVHLIMMFQFGLWKFELIVLLLYGFLLNDAEWRAILPKSIGLKYFPKQIQSN